MTSNAGPTHRFQDGRKYHAFDDRAYYLPNDHVKVIRLGEKVAVLNLSFYQYLSAKDLQHMIWLMTLENNLYIYPVVKSHAPQLVLDDGTGTGAWAIEFTKRSPSSRVGPSFQRYGQPETFPITRSRLKTQK